MIYKSMLELIGHTPLVEAGNYARKNKLQAQIVLKLEGRNPAGSAKDRVGLALITDAEERDLLKKGATIIEPTSGNTGIGLAAVAAVRGYRAIIVMPDSMSQERRQLLKAFGAELVLTPGKDGMAGSIAKAEELARSIPGSFIPGQFDNPANPLAHYRTTGPEIWQDTAGKVDIFVAGTGTGGTVSGTGKYLKEMNKDIRIVAVEPAESPLLSGGTAGPHKIQGIGANFVPANYDPSVIDEVLPVTGDASYAAVKELLQSEGLLVGISGGAALAAATILAQRPENAGKLIVALMPDNGDRYLSTPGFMA